MKLYKNTKSVRTTRIWRIVTAILTVALVGLLFASAYTFVQLQTANKANSDLRAKNIKLTSQVSVLQHSLSVDPKCSQPGTFIDFVGGGDNVCESSYYVNGVSPTLKPIATQHSSTCIGMPVAAAGGLVAVECP
jgi:hypothetical protein